MLKYNIRFLRKKNPYWLKRIDNLTNRFLAIIEKKTRLLLLEMKFIGDYCYSKNANKHRDWPNFRRKEVNTKRTKQKARKRSH